MMIVLTKDEFGCRGEDAVVKFPYLVLNVTERWALRGYQLEDEVGQATETHMTDVSVL